MAPPVSQVTALVALETATKLPLKPLGRLDGRRKWVWPVRRRRTARLLARQRCHKSKCLQRPPRAQSKMPSEAVAAHDWLRHQRLCPRKQLRHSLMEPPKLRAWPGLNFSTIAFSFSAQGAAPEVVDMRYTYPEEISCLPNFMVWWWWWWWWDCALVVSSVFYSIYGVSAAVPALLTSRLSFVRCPCCKTQNAERASWDSWWK